MPYNTVPFYCEMCGDDCGGAECEYCSCCPFCCECVPNPYGPLHDKSPHMEGIMKPHKDTREYASMDKLNSDLEERFYKIKPDEGMWKRFTGSVRDKCSKVLEKVFSK